MFSCMNKVLFKDIEANHAKYIENENPILLDMRVTNQKVKDFTKMAE